MYLNRQLLQASFDGVVQFTDLSRRFANVEGFLQPIEGFILYWLAKNVAVQGSTVEIGSFKGRSTCWLAKGTSDRGSGVVTAVDHFIGSPEHQAGMNFEDRDIVTSGSTLPKFTENLAAHGLSNFVEPKVGDSSEIGSCWDAPIRLLFIDGDHSYEATKKDFDIWSKHVPSGGVVAFHDVGGWPGVTKFFDEICLNPTWSVVGRIHSVGIIEKK